MVLQLQYHLIVSVSYSFHVMHMYIMYTDISDEMCYCTFRIANMEYAIGPHTLTFQSILNGEVRGSTSTMFLVTDGKLIKTHYDDSES